MTAAEEAMVRDVAAKASEQQAKDRMSVKAWVHAIDWLEANELLVSRPTVNIEGQVDGHTGPGGKTVLPRRVAAKVDLRLVPDITAADTLANLKAHIAERGFGDIEMNFSGSYDPASTQLNTTVIQAISTVYQINQGAGHPLPRLAGPLPSAKAPGQERAAPHTTRGESEACGTPDGCRHWANTD